MAIKKSKCQDAQRITIASNVNIVSAITGVCGRPIISDLLSMLVQHIQLTTAHDLMSTRLSAPHSEHCFDLCLFRTTNVSIKSRFNRLFISYKQFNNGIAVEDSKNRILGTYKIINRQIYKVTL